MLLKHGSNGQDVKMVQQKLGLPPNGEFDDRLEEAVKNWQLKNELFPDGIIKDSTWNKMFEGDAFAPTRIPHNN